MIQAEMNHWMDVMAGLEETYLARLIRESRTSSSACKIEFLAVVELNENAYLAL